MVETYEIQLFSKYLSLVSDADQSYRRPPKVAVTVRGTVGDPLFIRIGELDQHLRQSKLGFAFGSWTIKRTYSEKELARAQLFMLNVPMTHVAAEEYGTEYQEDGGCEYDGETLEHLGGTKFRIVPRRLRCGLGSKQVGPLRLPFAKLRKNQDVYRPWGGELVVSERLANLMSRGEFSGWAFFPISDVKKELTSPLELSDCPAGVELLSTAAAKGMRPRDWDSWCWLNEDVHKPPLERMIAQQRVRAPNQQEGTGSRHNLAQLVLQSKPLEISRHSRFGATPFDTGAIGRHRCDAGETAGMRPISSVSVIGSSWDGSDLCRTRVYVGGPRQGLFRPYQLFVVSKKFLKALQHHGIKGFQLEVVELTG